MLSKFLKSKQLYMIFVLPFFIMAVTFMSLWNDAPAAGLEIDEEEAILTWLEDEEYLTNDEQDELTEQAKENKSVKIIDAKALLW